MTFYDPLMPWPDSSTNKSNFSFTMMIHTTTAEEVFPPHFQFPTASKGEDQQWAAATLDGMQGAFGKFGNNEAKWFSATFGANK